MARTKASGDAATNLGHWKAGDVAMHNGRAIKVVGPVLKQLDCYSVRFLKSGKVETVRSQDIYHVSEP